MKSRISLAGGFWRSKAFFSISGPKPLAKWLGVPAEVHQDLNVHSECSSDETLKT
jgi:hypothetical protein